MGGPGTVRGNFGDPATVLPAAASLCPTARESLRLSRSQFAIDVPDSLVARARTGCREAFEQIYRRFERPVFTLALRICGDREAAGDVLQDTMLKLFHHLPDYRGDCPFWGWLRQIAVNEALLRLRRQKRLVAEITVEEDNLPQDQGLPPAAAADAALLQRALEALPAATRSVLWLYHAEGYTHDEIAELMQRTPSFSKSQVSRGTRRLRALLNIEDTVHA